MDLPAEETWGNPNTLARHFRDHGADFGATSAEDYANQASRFFQRSQIERLPTKIDSDGVIRVYDPQTNTFGSYNPNGTTKTFFTPKRGIDYWNDQPGTSPWTGQ
jgi:pyocin large subunit-like protein